MRIVVTNAVLSNTGDSAIYAAIRVSLEGALPGPLEIHVCDSNARVTSKLYPEWTISQQLSVSPAREPAVLRKQLQKVRRAIVGYLTRHRGGTRTVRTLMKLPALRRSQFAQTWNALEAADLIVSSGGTYLVDHYDFSPRADEFDLLKSMSKPIVLWTQSLGPFASERGKRLALRTIPNVDGVFFRDDTSRRSWSELSVPPALSAVVPDVVFALQPVGNRIADPPGSRRKKALISVRQWNSAVDSGAFDRRDYERAMAAGAAKLIDIGLGVDALSTCQGVPEYAYDDSDIAEAIFAGQGVRINRDFHRPDELLSLVGDASLVIATRMHFSIMALISQVPVIAIAYEFKTLELFESVGLGHLVIAIEDVTPQWIADTIELVVRDPQSHVLTSEQLERLRREAQAPARLVRESSLVQRISNERP